MAIVRFPKCQASGLGNLTRVSTVQGFRGFNLAFKLYSILILWDFCDTQ